METLLNNVPDMLDIHDLQRVMHIGRSTAYRLIQEEKIRHIKIGKKIIIPKRYLLVFIENQSNLCYNDKVMVGNPTCHERSENHDRQLTN